MAGVKRIPFAIAVFWLLLNAATFGQLDVKSGTRLRLDSSAGLQTIGNTTFMDVVANLSTTMVGIVRVETEAANIEVSASDISRNPGEVQKIADKVYIIDQPGKWWVDVTAIDFQKNLYGRKSLVLEIGSGPTPTPPEPGPGPSPPSPDAPIEGTGLRVLFVYESAIPLSKEHQTIVYGQKVRDYLNKYAAKGDDGKTPDWRLLDADTTYTDPNNRWAKALARPRTTLPWLVISNGVTGWEGPLPTSEEEVILAIDSFVTAKSSIFVEMLTTNSCSWCEVFRQYEKPKLKVPFQEIHRKAAMYPTFIVRVNGKESKLEGYHTAETIHAEVKRLGGAL